MSESILTYTPVLAIAMAVGMAASWAWWARVRYVAAGVLFTEALLFVIWVAAIGNFSIVAHYAIVAMLGVLGFAAGFIPLALVFIMAHVESMLMELKTLMSREKRQ
jgi:asparagine N-glycosylation enzyme membrane subunit Stt3